MTDHDVTKEQSLLFLHEELKQLEQLVPDIAEYLGRDGDSDDIETGYLLKEKVENIRGFLDNLRETE